MDHEAVEEIKRHFGVVAEGLRSDIQLVAEGPHALDERLTRRIVDDLKTDMDAQFEDVKAMIRFAYAGRSIPRG